MHQYESWCTFVQTALEVAPSWEPYCCRTAAKGLETHPRLTSNRRVLPAHHHFSRVEPRGVEPLTSAVQRRRSPD